MIIARKLSFVHRDIDSRFGWQLWLCRILLLFGGVLLHPPHISGEPLPAGAFARFTVGTPIDLAFAENGKQIVALDFEPAIHLIEIPGGRVVRRIDVEGQCGGAISTNGRIAAVIRPVGAVQLWDLRTWKPTVAITMTDSPPNCLAFSPNGAILVTGSSDGCLTWWDSRTGKMLQSTKAGVRRVDSLAFSPDGRLLAMGDYCSITLRLAEGPIMRRIPAYCGAQFLAFAPDGRSLASSGSDSTTRLWETATGQERDRFPTLSMANNPIAFTNYGLLAIGGPAKRIHLYDPFSGDRLADWSGHDSPIRRLASSPDGSLASFDDGGTILLWDSAAMRRKRPAGETSEMELRRLWNDLTNLENGPAWIAMRSLSQFPAGTVRFARSQLVPAPPRPAIDVPAAIRDLGSTRFADRERATIQLREILSEVAPQLILARTGDLPPEARRRIDALLRSTMEEPTPTVLQALRGVELLERIGTLEANRLLEELAKGEPTARLTKEANASVERMTKMRGEAKK